MSSEKKSIIQKMDSVSHDFETERVPEDLTRPWWELAMIWGGLNTAALGLLFGAYYVGSGLEFSTVISFILVGNAIVVAFYTLVGSTGVIERVSAPYVAQRLFGEIGTLLYSAFLGILIMGWGAIMIQLLGQGVHTWIGVLPLNAWYLVVALVVASTTLVGYKGLSALSDIVIPIFAVSIPAVGIKAIQAVGWSNMWGVEREFGLSFTFLSGITFVVGMIALGAAQSQAISRYAKRARDIPLAAAIAIYWGHMVWHISGAGIAAYASSADVFQLFGVLGPLGIFLFFTTLWTTADNDFYYAGLAFTRLYPKWPKWRWTAIAMLIGLGYIYVDILSLIENWISLLGIYLPPTIGMFVADYYLLPVLGIDRPSALDVKQKINPAGFVSWILAAALLYSGISLTQVKPVDAAIFGLVIYGGLGYAQFKTGITVPQRDKVPAQGGD